MNKLLTLLCALIITSYVFGATTIEPATIYQDEEQTIKIKWGSADTAPTFTDKLVWAPSSGTGGDFGTCTKSATEIVCTGVKIATAGTMKVNNDKTPPADTIGEIIVTAGQTLASVSPPKIKVKEATEVTFTFGKEYTIVPTISIGNSTAVAGTSCALAETDKKIAKCSFTLEAEGLQKILVNKLDYKKTLEIKGSYLMLSLSILLISFLF